MTITVSTHGRNLHFKVIATGDWGLLTLHENHRLHAEYADYAAWTGGVVRASDGNLRQEEGSGGAAARSLSNLSILSDLSNASYFDAQTAETTSSNPILEIERSPPNGVES